MNTDPDRSALRARAALNEADAVTSLGHALTPEQRQAALATGRELVAGARARASERSYLDAFLQEFGLSNPEGIALMCLAEALLRVPDSETADRLIAEKLSAGDWDAHSGRSDSLLVNASTWGLMLTGRMVELPGEMRDNFGGWLRGLTRRFGDPLVRQAVRRAMQIIGGEFVVGRNIDEALARSAAEPALALCSFDMLGEGARTDADADRYFESYRKAIARIGAATRAQRGGSAAKGGSTASGGSAAGDDLHARSAISVKLSALDPRYSLAQQARVRARLVPRAIELARRAAAEGIGFTVDAEEADRLEISLDVIAALAADAETRDWPGLGLAIQAYGKRAPAVIDWVDALAQQHRRRMSARLVKGAYWDSEIKRAQERGLASFPVYTRKVSTDISYLRCAEKLLAVADRIYPQFATHNAHTIGAVLALRAAGAFEFQRLHGMGVLLYDEAARALKDFPRVRVYAPVGAHADLLAYLVRRLLENGANTSFVNRFLDERVPVEKVVADPYTQSEALLSLADPRIPLPVDLYGSARRNSMGVDFGDPPALAALADAAQRGRANGGGASGSSGSASTVLARAPRVARGAVAILNPADHRDQVGELQYSTAKDVTTACDAAAAAQPGWNAAGAAERARCLEAAADALEAARADFCALLVREAGKTLGDAVGEVREAADLCRYYAAEARRQFAAPLLLRGPTGETNELSLHGRGVFACISPWNFPLAIFVGQIAAALAAGNAVIAKPAESTPLVALRMVALLHAAGVPRDVLHCLPMEGPPFAEAAFAHPALAGVAFTGSTATGQSIQRRLAARDGAILPLIAETGGLNCMVVDSTALLEQVTDDALSSAFGSAGQRCSALRLLCVQEDVAEPLLELLSGAMDTLVVGDPALPVTDVGPLINARAVAQLETHLARMRSEARSVRSLALGDSHANGSFLAPHLVELRDAGQLRSETFGPILHVLRYRADRLDALLAGIRNSGYGLTLGVQTRLESTWRKVYSGTTVGNTYVNRNMIGAVVGVQPFGGSGLSGTGPKAGGPHYLARFANERTLTINTMAAGGNPELLRLD